jgi:8-oxo-dGTP pyrophosphatase MutT (NUDIX family)
MDPKKWKTTKTTVDYKNEFFQIKRLDIVKPDGNKGKFYVLDKYAPFFSVIIPLSDNDKTYLVGQFRVASQVYSWEFPMGSVRGATNPLKVAKQELKEETGLVAEEWHEIGWYYLANGHTDQKVYVFSAKKLTQEKTEPEPGEFLRVKQVPIKQVGLMIKKGEITDGPTITAYCFIR